ncbi:tetratricopeptide repeat protein [Nisaea nitritireducens]|uniref:tetratricopeptide repeat protein n=1 Tax=Nisaea nitritireducens TaxID=568392 RepID=UPI0018671BEB|nr:tetratricopeptide repeat protein [Nisaea nitritireducens]
MRESRDSLLADCQQLMANGKWNEARSRLENAFAAAPTDVLIAYSLATACRLSGMTDRAAQLFQAIHTTLPDMAEAVIGLAHSLAELGASEQANDVLRRAIIRSPSIAPVYTAYGEIALKSGNIHQVEPAFSRAVIIVPASSKAQSNLAEILSQQERFSEAEPHYQSALQANPENQQLRLNYGVHLLSQGKVREGWAYYEARLSSQISSAPVRSISIPRWDGTCPEAHNILILNEQGLGDELRFAAMLPELSKLARSITLECDPRLVGLFERSIPAIRAHGFSRHKRSGRGHFSYAWLPESGGPDCYVEIGSLRHFVGEGLRPQRNDCGFLIPRMDLTQQIGNHLRAQAAGRHIVGVSWTSGSQTFGRGVNYPPPSAWRDLLDLPNTLLVSLQYGETEEMIAEFEEATGHKLYRIAGLDLRNDLESLAALASSLDLMLSVGNSTAAIVGAVGTKTIEFLTSGGWVPLSGDRDSFIGAIRRIKQTRLGDWARSMIIAKSLALEILENH